MTNAVVIKQSPVILFRNFVAIEILGFVGYAIAAALGNYKYELYTRLSFSEILSYQIAKLLFLLGAELAMTAYAFLRWHREIYTIEPGSITHQKGVFFKKQETRSLRREMSVKPSSGLLAKLLHYGTVSIYDPASQGTGLYPASRTTIAISNISTPQKYVKVIERFLDGENLPREKNLNVEQLLREDEHERLEFKSSLRFDLHGAQVNHNLEKAAMKTVAGFLNSKGGNLVIGVGDLPAPGRAGRQAGAREPIGLRHDYETLRRRDSDGFENHFTQIFNAMIGPEFRHLVKLRFPAVRNQELCVISVAPSARPIYLKLDDTEHFYVRTGNVTTPLKMSEVESYARSHWLRRTS